jgi:G3E family GTPase
VLSTALVFAMSFSGPLPEVLINDDDEGAQPYVELAASDVGGEDEEYDEDDEYEEQVPEEEKTPVTIVTGFLGAGKTTLVNYILQEQKQWKVAVIENEFGEVSIDDDLVADNIASAEDIIIMDNGCACCTVRGDLVRTFGMLVERRKKFDAMILETTGLADPAPIIFTFNTNPMISDNYRIDSILCLADAKNIELHLDEQKPDGSVNEAEHQVAFADKILLNKIDLVSPRELESVHERIKGINSFAEIIHTERSRAPLDHILGLSSFSLEHTLEVDPALLVEDAPEPDAHAHTHEHGHGHDHDHDCSECQEHAHHSHAEESHGMSLVACFVSISAYRE